ncbi:MAG: capsule biosynthesis protein [Alphaproteobacteria bacterium]|nr:capsule biosynthesis protein [Alphaproteobacteria bacterium]
MTHLQENNIGYFQHLYRAWRWAFILIIHGIYPEIYKTTVSDEICKKKKDDWKRYSYG